MTVEHIFDSDLTKALILCLTAVASWFVAKKKYSKVSATVDGKVKVDRQPPFPEEAYKKFVTKGEFDKHRDDTDASVRRLHEKIEANEKDHATWREGTSRVLGGIESSINTIKQKLKV